MDTTPEPGRVSPSDRLGAAGWILIIALVLPAAAATGILAVVHVGPETTVDRDASPPGALSLPDLSLPPDGDRPGPFRTAASAFDRHAGPLLHPPPPGKAPAAVAGPHP